MNAAVLLLFPLAFGLLMLILLLLVRGPARRVIFILAMALTNLGVLAVVAAVYLVSRLDGSRPPGLLEVLAPLGAHLLFTVVLNAGLVFARRRG